MLRRFRSVEQMTEPYTHRPRDPDNLRLALQLSELCARLRPARFPAGLHKHRSVEEAARQRARWEAEA